MLNLSDKRQHFRFPVYDDEIGVKLVSNKRREFLKDILDDGFVYKKHETSYSSTKQPKKENVRELNIDPVSMVEAPDYFGYNQEMASVEEVSVYPKEKTTAFVQKEVKVDKERKTLNNHTYIESEPDKYLSPQSTFSNNLVETDNFGNAMYNKTERGHSKFESSYNLPGTKGPGMFKPKHIPASLIDDSKEASRHSRDVIVNELRKASNGSLLLLEDDIVLDPIMDQVDMVSSEEGKMTSELPGKKKNNRLEKTLSGIMLDESSSRLDSNYFD